MYNDSIVNSTTESPEDYERPVSPYSLPVKITLGVVVVVITVVAIVGNALILTAFFTTARLRRLTNYFYASLAVTDLLAGLLVMPFMASYTLLFYWNFWKPFCMAWLCMDMFLYSASVYHMCVICLDRFLAITFPLKYRLRRTKKLILGFIATAWALALIFEVPATLIYEHVSGESVVAYHKECDVEWVEDVAVTVVSFLVTVVIPFFFTLVLYVHIFVTIRRSHRYSKPVGERKGDMNADKSKEGRKKYPIQITCLPDTACFICPIKRAKRDKELEQVDDTELEAGSNQEKRRDSENRNTQRRPCRSCCRFSRNSSYDVSGCGNDPHEVVDDHRDSVTMIDFQYNDLTQVTSVQRSVSETCERITSDGNKALTDGEGYSRGADVISREGENQRNFGNRISEPIQGELEDNSKDHGRENNMYCYANQAVSTDTLQSVSMPTDTDPNDGAETKKEATGKGTNCIDDQRTAETDLNEMAGAKMQGQQNGRRKSSLHRFRQLSTVVVNMIKLQNDVNNDDVANQNARQSMEAILARQKAKERRAAATLGILLGVFLVTWLPWKVTTIADAIAGKYLFSDLWYEIAIWLQYSNSMINPFLYMFRDKEFRFAVKRIICRSSCRQNSDSPRSSVREKMFKSKTRASTVATQLNSDSTG